MAYLLYDAAVAVAEFLYTIVIVFLMDAMVKRRLVSHDMSRKIVHLWAGGLIIFWFLFAGPFQREFFSITPLIWIILLAYTALAKGPDDPTVVSMTRTGNPKELLYGTLFFPIMFIIITFLSFKGLAGITAISVMAFGDGIAPIVGKYSKHRYFKGKKSLEGSISVFLGGLAGTVVFAAAAGIGLYSNIYAILVALFLATIAEAVTPSNYDNITVPMVALATIWLAALL